jgi:CubicO group peptidase (beta-lactamase class C family)
MRVNEHTLYDLASLTKSVGTTSAVMLLVQQGRLDLDRPLADYFEEWRGAFDRRTMTARQLLNHTSGLPPGGELAGVGRDRGRIPAFMAQSGCCPARPEVRVQRLWHDPAGRAGGADHGERLMFSWTRTWLPAV